MTNHRERFAKLVARLNQFDLRQLEAVEQAVDRIEVGTKEKVEAKEKGNEGERIQSDAGPSHSKEVKDWPRAPLHRLGGKDAFIVTGGTLNKLHHFRDVESLRMLPCSSWPCAGGESVPMVLSRLVRTDRNLRPSQDNLQLQD